VRILLIGIKYCLCDLIQDVINYCALCFVFICFHALCSTLLSHFVYWIVLSAGLASPTIQQPQLTIDLHRITGTVVVVVE